MSEKRGMARRQGFTLIELLVVIAVIGILIALLLPAVQKVREAANRIKCQNNLKQVAIAAHSYHDAYDMLPSAFRRGNDPNLAPAYQYQTWVLVMLPFIEQDVLKHRWQDLYTTDPNFSSKRDANMADPGGPGAQALKVLVCPSDGGTPIPAIDNTTTDPTYNDSPRAWGLTSYYANAGKRSYSGGTQTKDGVMYEDSAVRLTDITDGTSNTLMFGERYRNDMVFNTQAGDNLITWGWWASAAPGDVQLSAAAPINYSLPGNFSSLSASEQQNDYDLRLNAFGSGHTFGTNFALADGSVHFLSQALPLLTLQNLSTRSGGEPISDY